MSCIKHGYTNNVFCPMCDLETIEQNKPYKLTHKFFTRSEIKHAVWQANAKTPICRAGQAFCNIYLKEAETWPELFYEENKEKAIQMIHEHCSQHNIGELYE